MAIGQLISINININITVNQNQPICIDMRLMHAHSINQYQYPVCAEENGPTAFQDPAVVAVTKCGDSLWLRQNQWYHLVTLW